MSYYIQYTVLVIDLDKKAETKSNIRLNFKFEATPLLVFTVTSSNNILSVNSWPNQIEQRFCLPFVFISKKIDFENLNDFILYYADASKFGILK